MTGFAKTDLIVTSTEIHLLSVDESHTHALSKDTKHLRLDGHTGLLLQVTLSNHEGHFIASVAPEGH